MRHLLKNLQVYEGTARSVFGFSPTKNISTKIKKVNPRNDKWWLCVADPTEVPAVMHAKEVSINNDGLVNADAYVETLQTIVIRPPWVDNVANGGRHYVFQQESVPSHKALKTQD
ncbi:hypothetical protein ACTXT7_006654 [Hymenolepis weldensis]